MAAVRHPRRSRPTRRLILSCLVTLGVLTALPGSAAFGQVGSPVPDQTIGAAERAAIIDSMSATLNRNYVFPEVAKKMETAARKKLKSGGYNTITSARQFADVLTADLMEVCHDGHFGIRYAAEIPPNTDSLTDEQRAQYLAQLKRDNFGFRKVERLPGNIGYVDFRQFVGAEYAAPTAIAAMNFLGNCDAIIFDLRQNGGGEPSMIQLLTSYLLKQSTHLNSFYIRQSDSIQQFWSSAWVPGPRLDNADVYVLTSHFTFSGAEEFSYNIKNLKRGSIVGEVTGGGAHPVSEFYFANLHFGVRVPFGRAINPVSGANWEGVGVKPDVEVPADQALIVAQTMALKKLIERQSDEAYKQTLVWQLEGLEAIANPVTLSSGEMAAFVGTFGERTITFENGALFYQRTGRPKLRMTPMSTDLFRFDAIDYFRLKFVRDAAGAISAIEGRYDNGRVDQSPKGPSK
jgi:retinol-binding protein 3